MDKIWDRNTFEVGGHWPLQLINQIDKIDNIIVVTVVTGICSITTYSLVDKRACLCLC